MAREVSIATGNVMVGDAGSFDGFAAHCRAVLDRAAGADLVVLPELLTVELFTCLPDWRERSLAEMGEIDAFTDRYRALFADEARARRQWVLAGSHLTRQDGRLLNVAHLFGPDGEMVTHAKTHLFPAERDWNGEEGDEMHTIDLPFARAAVNICYEAEVPECASTVTRAGAEIVLCPSYTLTEHGFWRVRHCAQARAIEDQIYVVHSCLGGEAMLPLPGGWARGSILSPCDAPWNPDGVVAQVDANVEAMVVATIDLDALHQNREDGAAPTFRDRIRRRDVYERWSLEEARA
jgi:predicted amidohydrolase